MNSARRNPKTTDDTNRLLLRARVDKKRTKVGHTRRRDGPAAGEKRLRSAARSDPQSAAGGGAMRCGIGRESAVGTREKRLSITCGALRSAAAPVDASSKWWKCCGKGRRTCLRFRAGASRCRGLPPFPMRIPVLPAARWMGPLGFAIVSASEGHARREF